ncbi:MAG TPA: carboxypeptidase regulatory-like domain-containing protein [Candidatus Sulfotelmatobacter sp.]|nr:carboxypeptidase regulatory-like domain-containing protein [Candidatus Sulfotelmatobacter sp.]
MTQTRITKLLYIGLAVLLSLCAVPQAFTQSTGTIRGTVTDPSGAVIPSASVTATATTTGINRTAASNDSGIFVFPDLPIGVYSLKIEARGFATQERPGLNLLTGQTIDLPISMSVGTQSTRVTVTSEMQQIQTTTSTVAQSITQEQMHDLPLNGRNPLQLTTLTAGAVVTTAGTENTQQDNPGLSVNGLRATQNTYTLDGTIYVDRFFDSVPTMPNPDALQEFTIQASNYSADHAGAGALVQLSTRSGTSELHGEAWDYFRNTVLNARNYFWHHTYEPPFKMNQFGGTVGGPVFKSKKAFFFFSAEDLQQRSAPTPITIQVPTPAELTGDFSAFKSHGIALYNPATGCGWGQTGSAPNCSGTITDVISTPMDALSAAVTKQYLQSEINASSPATGSNSGKFNTLTTSTNNNIDNTQYLVRLDDSIGDKDHLSGHYFYNQDNFQRPFTAPLGFFALNLFRNQDLTISDAHVFSNTLTGALYVGAFRGARTQIPEAPGLKTLKNLGQNINYGSPTESLVPFPGVRANLSYINIFSGGALTQDSTTFDIDAQIVKVLHTHTLSMGGELERDRIDMDDFSYTPGDNSFSAQQTQAPTGTTLPSGFTASGDPFASFYLGYESSFFQDNGRKAYLREVRPSLYFQDDWKARPKLTLNLGVRWDPWMPPVDNNGTLVGFNFANPNFQSTVAPGAPKGLWFVGDPGLPKSVFKNNYKDFAPRVGFAYNVFGNGKTVVRGAYGIFYGFPEGLLYQRTDAMQPVDLFLNIPAPPHPWDDIYAGYPGGDPFPRGHVGPSQFKNYKFITPLSGGVLNPTSKVEYTQAYNFTIEQSLSHGFAMNVGWVGNHAVHVMASRQFNPAVGAPSSGVENNFRIFPGLGAVELADTYDYAMTNALEVNVTRRSAHGLNLLSNVVWMKTIDNGSSGTEGQAGPPNPFNLNSARGVADFDQALRFTTSANYPIPHMHVSGVAGAFANDWQLNGILTMQSGLPLTITSGVDNSHSGVGNDYADFVKGVSTKRPAGVSKLQEWFNTAAFQKNAVGTFGNVPRNILRGPGYADVDLSLFKDIAPEHRFHAQFQAEAFNALNHTNFANPTTSVSSGTFGQITSTSTSTGTVNSPTTAGAQRVWQFALKLMF